MGSSINLINCSVFSNLVQQKQLQKLQIIAFRNLLLGEAEVDQKHILQTLPNTLKNAQKQFKVPKAV